MRMVAGITLGIRGFIELRTGPPVGLATLDVLASGAGILLLAGLWTPIAGALVTVIEIWSAFSYHGDPWAYMMLGTLAAALALLGPGAWSVDARLFGWKRIEIRERNS